MKILFFSPHAYWAVHSLPEALVAETLKLEGHEVLVVNCDGVYKGNCVCMPLVRLDDLEEKRRICNTCKNNRDLVNKEFSFRSINIEKHIDDTLLSDVNNIVNSATVKNYLGIELDGVPVARYALYEFVLNHKLSSTDIPLEFWSEYKENLRNALLTFHAIRKIIQSEGPERIVTYNSLYGVNRITCAVADQFNIPHFTLHAGSHHQKRIQQITIFKGIEASVLVNQHPALPYFRKTPLCEGEIEIVNQHVQQLFDATSYWVYTIKSKKILSSQLRAQLGIKNGQKTLLAVMRSNDERFGLDLAGMNLFDSNPVFQNQYEWLDWLVEFAKKNPNYFIIFRVHPREYPNKRENKVSQNAVRFERYISSLRAPDNLKINTPDNNLSLHDLLKITDVVLNNTSSVGLEACLFGIPVIGMSERTYAFDPILQAEAIDLPDYEVKIREAINSGLDFGRVVAAYRWLNYLFSEVSIDISDGYSLKQNPFRLMSNFILRVCRKLKISSLPSSPMGHIVGRSRPLKNKEALAYAIVNGVESHIGCIAGRTSTGDIETEKKLIANHYIHLMRKISKREDREFWSRVKSFCKVDL